MLVDCDGGGDNRNDRVVDIVMDTGICWKDRVLMVIVNIVDVGGG